MALSFPYALDFLAECLVGEEVPLVLNRYDEHSGSGDGRHWPAQLATPLWGASYPLYAHTAAKAREINAKVHGLDGMAKTFLWGDLYYRGPAFGNAGLGSVTISSIRGDRAAIALSGTPGGFNITAGDCISINYSSGRVYFGQFAESGTGQRELRPYLPLGISPGATVEMLRPRFKAMVKEFTPFSIFRGAWGRNASITLLQKP